MTCFTVTNGINMNKFKIKSQYIKNSNYAGESTLVINPSKLKSKRSLRPSLLSSFVIASGFLVLLLFSLNATATPSMYECTDTEVVGFTGIFDEEIEAAFMYNNSFQIEIDPINQSIKTLTELREDWNSDGDNEFTKAYCETMSGEDKHYYSVCSDHYGQIIFNYDSNEYTRTYHSGLVPFTDYILLGYGRCEEIKEIKISPDQIVG